MENIQLTNESMILLDIDETSKEEVIKKIAETINRQGIIENYTEFEKALFAREDIGATAVGYNFGLPHGKSKTVKKPAVAFAILRNPIIWATEDDEEEEAKYVFMIAIPDSQAGNEHINILVNLSKKILDDDFREKLINVKNEVEAVNLINS